MHTRIGQCDSEFRQALYLVIPLKDQTWLSDHIQLLPSWLLREDRGKILTSN